MHQKLRHQLNIHKISGSYKPKYLCILLTPFFFFIKNKHAFKRKSRVDLACTVNKPDLRERGLKETK
jgi:hypothetical protein